MNTIIMVAFVVIVGIRGALAIVTQRARAGAYGALPPITGQRAVMLGISNVMGVSAILISHLRPEWPAGLRSSLLWGGFFLILIMETIAVVWAREKKA